MNRRRFAFTMFLALPFAARLSAQGKKKSYTFHGKVESMDAAAKSMTVNGDKVEGWMEAMTMNYKVDSPDVFKTVKVGDMIEATVYDDDITLYKIHVVAPGKKK